MGFSSTFMPEAEAANQYLWVSAENAENGNTFYGGQVLEIVVNDPAINRLDEAYGMPDVTIDGKKVIMAQAVDGAWYAYVADATYANNIDAIYGNKSDNGTGIGADYGRFGHNGATITYNATSSDRVTAITLTEAVGFTFNGKAAHTSSCQGVDGYTQGTAITTCTNINSKYSTTQGVADGTNATENGVINVVREPRALSNVTTTQFYGNIGLAPAYWPMIQLYDFSDDQVVDIDYDKGGQTEEVDLIFIDNAIGIVLDKERFGLLHEVGVELIDWNLNLDPTDEDSWTFATNPNNASAFYQLFDENGSSEADNGDAAIANDANTMSGTFGIPGILTIDRDGAENASANVTHFQTNADVNTSSVVCGENIYSASNGDTEGLCGTKDINAVDAPMTMIETGANTGHFVNWDDGLVTQLFISKNAARGTTATIAYDDVRYTILHMPSFGSVEYDTSSIGSEWNSGEIVNINVIDEDMNYDVRQEDALSINSNTTIVPAIKVGSPITLKNVEFLKVGTATIGQSLDTLCSSDYGAAGTNA